jgi:hypothetical protein
MSFVCLQVVFSIPVVKEVANTNLERKGRATKEGGQRSIQFWRKEKTVVGRVS